MTFLPGGSFEGYTEQRVREGADLGHMKPQHMNAPDRAIDLLLEAAEQAQRARETTAAR